MSIYSNEKPGPYFECLDSLYKQTLKPNEVVIVHDGFISNELLAIENEFKNKLPIKVFNLDKNYGAAIARNYGADYCSNEWIAIMDSDDICSPDRFEKQISYIKNHPEVDFLGGNIAEFDSRTYNNTGRRVVPGLHNDIVVRAKTRMPVNHVTVMFKKMVFQDIGRYKHLLYLEDYYLILRAINKGYRFANLDDILVYVRSGSDMYARRKGYQYFKNECYLFKYMYSAKLISIYGLIVNLVPRFILRLLPVCVLEIFYKLALRDKG